MGAARWGGAGKQLAKLSLLVTPALGLARLGPASAIYLGFPCWALLRFGTLSTTGAPSPRPFRHPAIYNCTMRRQAAVQVLRALARGSTAEASNTSAAAGVLLRRSFADDASLLKTPLYDYHVAHGGRECWYCGGGGASGGGRRRAAGTQGFQASIFTLFATNL